MLVDPSETESDMPFSSKIRRRKNERKSPQKGERSSHQTLHTEQNEKEYSS